MKTATIALLALIVAALTGCGSAWEARRAALNAPNANVAGTWTGTTTGEDKSFPITLTLDQTGTEVTGTIRITGRPDISGRVRGSVQGEVLSLVQTTAPNAGGDLWVQQDNMMTSTPFGLHFTLRRSK